jgi:hypothetical protein
VRAVALAAALALCAAACGSGAPAKTLLPGTLTIGAVVVSARDRVIAMGARIGVADIENAGGIQDKVRLRLITGRDAAALARRGARVVLLPCDPADQATAGAALAGRNVLQLATCNDRPLGRAWAVGPNLVDRADALFAAVRASGVKQVALRNAGAVLRRAAAAWKMGVSRTAGTVVTGGGWQTVPRRRAAYGLDPLDTVSGRRASPHSEGVVFATFGFASPGSKLDEIEEKYRLDYGARPDSSVVQLGYDATRVLNNAVEKAASTDPRALAAALPGLGVAASGGVLNYPPLGGGHQPRADVAVVQIMDGRLNFVHGGRPERP